MTTRALLLAVTVSVLGSCDDGQAPPAVPLEVASVSPAANMTDVETGVAVRVVFTKPVDPVTVTSQSLVVRQGGIALPGVVTYAAAARTATIAVPLLPGGTYELEVTTAVATALGERLGTPHLSTFATRTLQAVNVDSQGVGLTSALARDALGRLHVSYWDFTNSALKYATCATACTSAVSWQLVTVDSAGQLAERSAIAVDATGRVHVLYDDLTNGDLKYATCAAGCHLAASWQTAIADSGGKVGSQPTLAIDGAGRLHATYLDVTTLNDAALKYATCLSACTTIAAWQSATVQGGLGVGEITSALVVESSGAVHVSYTDAVGQDLEYASCTAGCTSAANWQTITIDAVGDVGRQSSIAVDPAGRLHIAYYEFTKDLEYASCAANCTVPASWQRVTVDSGGFSGETPSLKIDGAGRVHVSFYDRGGGQLTYATCAIDCHDVAHWRRLSIDGIAGVGARGSLVLGPQGRVHISYGDNRTFDVAQHALRYIE